MILNVRRTSPLAVLATLLPKALRSRRLIALRRRLVQLEERIESHRGTVLPIRTDAAARSRSHPSPEAIPSRLIRLIRRYDRTQEEISALEASERESADPS